MPNFPDINPGAHVAVNTGFGMTAATPLDLRTIVTDLTMMQAMIDAHWMCEGMLIYALSTKKYYQIYTNDQNQIAYKLFEVESSQVEQATEADHLSHTVKINGVDTDFSGTEVNINRLMPTLISNYAQDFDATTTPGQYYGADGNDNNYLLTIEAIGDDKLIRTMITIENGHIVTKQAIATKVNNVWTWGDWTLADGSVATAHISWLSPNVYINKPGGSLAERWIYSDSGSQYAADKTTIQTSDGQLFTVAAPPTAAIEHPFVVRLFSDGITKTATVESLKATNDVWGKVKLSDSVTDDSSGVNSGVAATPKAVASLNGRITKVNDSVAAGFSESTAYVVGDYVTYGFELYRCTTAHDAGAWNDAHFSKVTTTDELKAEATARETADTTLQTNIDNEATARENADATKADLTDLAADFSASTAYAVGDYVTHAGDLFRCTTAHAAGAWNAGHFKRVKVGDELKAKADLTDLAAEFSASTAYAVGDYVTHAGNLYRCTAAHSAGAWNNAHFTQVTVDSELNTEAATRDAQMKSIGVGKVYRATYSGTVSGGVFNVVWETTPTTINIGDIVIIKYTTAQPVQMAAIYLQVGSTYYEIAVGTLAANTTAYYHCSKTPTGSSTATAGKLQTAPTNGRLGVVEAKLAKIPVGMIVMWSGSSVPNGWALCDGTNGTPDLRNRFIMGGVLSEQTGYEVKGSTGGAKTQTAQFRILLNDIPRHAHIYVGDGNIPTGWTPNAGGGFSLAKDGEPNYDSRLTPKGMTRTYNYANQSIGGWSGAGSGSGSLYYTGNELYGLNPGTSASDPVDINNPSGKIGTAKKVTDSFDNRPPYYALAFIMFKG